MSSRVRRAQKGDKQAFTELINEHERLLFHTARAILGSEQEAADALQEAVLKAYLHIGSLREASKFKPWITRILVNECRDRQQHRSRIVPLSEYHLSQLKARNPGLDPADRIGLREALDRLNKQHREVLILYYLNDFTAPEIASILEIPVGTVRSRIHYALRKLRQLMEGSSSAVR